jgi:hypothetical protein
MQFIVLFVPGELHWNAAAERIVEEVEAAALRDEAAQVEFESKV